MRIKPLAHLMIVGMAVLCLAWGAHATVLDTPLADATQEEHARHLFRELRCVVCEGQSLADSDAALAIEMRAHIRTMVGQQQSDEAILSFFRERYGDRILMTPPVSSNTALLWCAPLLLLALGGALLWRFTRKGASE